MTPEESYLAGISRRNALRSPRLVLQVSENNRCGAQIALGGAPVFSYIFTHESQRLIPGTQHKMGAAHAAEIAYKFDNVQRSAATMAGAAAAGGPPLRAMPAPPPPSAADLQAASAMSEFWSSFARHGRPSAKGQPMWPAFDTKTRATMLINAQCKVVNDPGRLERQVWPLMDPA